MKKGILIFATAGLLLSGVSCGPNAQTGTALGGLAGAGLGAVIGNQSGRPLEGAGLGALAGGTAGALLGGAQDQRNQQRYDNRPYYDQAPPPRRY
ncbi:MAG: YMGG-like glycine zipper-containing protein [Verrucomicrobiales bacterium]